MDVKGANKVYRSGTDLVPALSGVSFSVEAGEFVSLLGPSGCGKSTLLWAIAGLKPLDSGTVWLGTKAVTAPQPEMSIIFQEPTLLPWRSVGDNIALPLELRPAARDGARERIARLIRRVGLEGFESRYPKELSGGMQQRASIVRALAADPSVLLLDEPFSALDPFTREDMNLLLQDLWLETRKTMVLVTHSIEEAILLSDRIIVMTPRPGRIRLEREVDLPRPRTLDLLSSPEFFSIAADVRRAIVH
ncbi:ABC transporter ATP-binding protein [Rhizobiales bacterium Sp-1]|uniref:ABC transporter ATP-binding protein n=1 Tax=Segnochrobactrum spirostomi TaxID=2608987 RepID=A0A6A7Y779_9HYPH|nr:ABC transporter ATP-binding protein [Segnochrobactrum spirostomi]